MLFIWAGNLIPPWFKMILLPFLPMSKLEANLATYLWGVGEFESLFMLTKWSPPVNPADPFFPSV